MFDFRFAKQNCGSLPLGLVRILPPIKHRAFLLGEAAANTSGFRALGARKRESGSTAIGCPPVRALCFLLSRAQSRVRDRQTGSGSGRMAAFAVGVATMLNLCARSVQKCLDSGCSLNGGAHAFNAQMCTRRIRRRVGPALRQFADICPARRAVRASDNSTSSLPPAPELSCARAFAGSVWLRSLLWLHELAAKSVLSAARESIRLRLSVAHLARDTMPFACPASSALNM